MIKYLVNTLLKLKNNCFLSFPWKVTQRVKSRQIWQFFSQQNILCLEQQIYASQENFKQPLVVMVETFTRSGKELKYWENIHPTPCVTYQVSSVMCHVSGIRCLVSGVRCHESGFFSFFLQTKWLIDLVEDLLSMGPNPSSLINLSYPRGHCCRSSFKEMESLFRILILEFPK